MPQNVIIKLWDDTSLDTALMLVRSVVEGGRISHGESFSSVTAFVNYHVYAHRTKTGTDVFQVCRNK